MGRDANEGWSYRNGRVSALSFRVWRQCGVPGCFLPQAQVKCSPRRDTVLGVVPWAITGRCPLCGAPAELEFDDMNVDGQPPGVLLNMWLAPMPAARFSALMCRAGCSQRGPDPGRGEHPLGTHGPELVDAPPSGVVPGSTTLRWPPGHLRLNQQAQPRRTPSDHYQY